MNDMFGNRVSTASASALAHYDRATDAHLHAWPGVGEAIDLALAEAPDFALPHALKALVLNGQGRPTLAREAIALAQSHSARALPREQSQLELIAAMVAGRMPDALAKAVEHARLYPTDLLGASTAVGAYGLFAFSGRADHDAARLAFTETLAANIGSVPPWLMAYQGWARIEAGRVEEGLAMAQQAIALRPQNAHNAHIVLHGFFERQDPAAGLDFVGAWLPQYPDHALMWGHIHWHAALAEIELGHLDAAVARLVGPIAGYLPRGTPFMGLIDLISLLWRLGLLGVQGLPWALAMTHAERHFPNGANVFGELHLTMLAAASADRPKLEASLHRLQVIRENGHAGAATAMRWAQSLLALLDDDRSAAREHLDACCEQAACLGGSHAQRSVVDQTRQALHLPATQPQPPARFC